MKKGDKILIGGVLLMAAIAFIWIYLTSSAGSKAVVRIDGDLAATYDLMEDRTVVIEGINGTNTLVIKDGSAAITHADCPDKLCVNQGEVSKGGESIVCLPHRVVVEIQSDEEPQVDQVVQ